MDDLISRAEAIAIIENKQRELCPLGRFSRHEVYGEDRDKFDAWQEIIDAIETIQAVDAAPVVRCEDCKYAEYPRMAAICNKFYGAGGHGFFCAGGDRRESE